MAGISLVTNQETSLAMQNVKKVALRLDYSVTEVSDSELTLRKGNAVAGVLLGAIFPYCNFRVVVRKNPDKTVEIDIHRNSPGLTGGTIGAGRVAKRAVELADQVEQAIREQQGEILRRSEF